jgi:hypothetical protein
LLRDEMQVGRMPPGPNVQVAPGGRKDRATRRGHKLFTTFSFANHERRNDSRLVICSAHTTVAVLTERTPHMPHEASLWNTRRHWRGHPAAAESPGEVP